MSIARSDSLHLSLLFSSSLIDGHKLSADNSETHTGRVWSASTHDLDDEPAKNGKVQQSFDKLKLP